MAVGGELSPGGSGVKVARTWQKCSFRLRKCGSDERLGIRIFPAMLETMRGVGHSWEADNFLTLGASARGSKVYSESGGMLHGRSTSTNSPGQTVIDVGVERSTIARRAAEFTVAEIVAKDHLALSWAYCNVVSFHKGGACLRR